MRTNRELLYLGGYALEPRVKGRYYGGSDPAPAQSSTTVQNTFSPEEEARRQKIFAEAERIYGATKDKFAGAYPGSVPVGPSGATTQAQGMVTNAATGTGQTIADNAANATNFGTSGAVLDVNRNPGLSGAIDYATRKVTQQYQDPGGVLSQIRSGFTGGSSEGTGTREGIASGIAGRNYLQTVGDISSTMTSDAYNKGLDYMSKSQALAPSTFGLSLAPGTSVGAVGAQQEGYSQMLNDYEAAQKQWGMQGEWQGLSPYTSLVTGMSNPATTTSATAPVAQKNSMAPLGMAAQGAALGTMVMPGWGTAIGAGAGLIMGMFAK